MPILKKNIPMKFYYYFLISSLSLLIIYNCSTEEEETPPPAVVETSDPDPDPVQYTLTATAGEGGTISTDGGTYDEGTSITIKATPNEGYMFIGWDGSDETDLEIVISINSNISISAIFQEVVSIESYYTSGDILKIEPVIFYDRSLTVNGIKIIVAGEIGGQQEVPDEWVYKTARVFQLLINKDAEGINSDAQLNMIKTLKGEIGWHENYPTGQRVAYGGGDEYSPNFLTDAGKQSYDG
jgi:hypothetical protein